MKKKKFLIFIPIVKFFEHFDFQFLINITHNNFKDVYYPELS